MPKQGYVYILASKKKGTLYIGVTSNLPRRVQQHVAGVYSGFTKRYKVNQLVYCEAYDDIQDAIAREKQLKEWDRQWKIELIESLNPDWHDLTGDWL